jgi:hypothetical protein
MTETNREKGLQPAIEAAMRRFSENRRWQGLILLSGEGFPLASQGGTGPFAEDRLLEFAFSLNATAALLEKNRSVTEIVLRSGRGTRLVFRYFTAWGESLVLIGVIDGRFGYKRAMDKLVRFIQQIS